MEDLRRYNPDGSDLRNAQLRMLEIAKVFDLICKKNNIKYWLMAGTLLGAKRHGGFIPWDDDFDVGVRFEDFNKLLEILKAELPNHLKLQATDVDPNYFLSFAKIRDLNSFYEEEGTEYFNYLYNGIFIDIFPFEPISSLWLKNKIDTVLYELKFRKTNYGKRQKIVNIKQHFFLPLAYVINIYLKLSRLWFKFFKGKIYSQAYGVPYIIEHKHKYDTIFPLGNIEFEGYFFPAPANVDQYLKDGFGNYMSIPPKEKRRTHSKLIQIFK